jgi:phosphonatase-like hydrolase
MQIQLVVLDMAGTTVQDDDIVNAALRDALGSGGVAVSREEANVYMGIAKPVAIRSLLESKGETSTPERVNTLHEDFLARMLAYYRTHPGVREIKGASATFRLLKAAGISIALDTGFSRPIADAILERLGWMREGLVDASVTSDEVARGRPYPDLIFRAMEQIGVTDVSSVAKVGDTPSDLQEGHAAGCGYVIGVTEGTHTRAQLEPYPHTHLIASVADLPALLLDGRQ